MNNPNFQIFLDRSLDAAKKDRVKDRAKRWLKSPLFVECTDGFAKKWHDVRNTNSDTVTSFFVTENHVESSDVVFAVFSAKIPTLSFAKAESPSPLLISRGDSEDEMVKKFFSCSCFGAFVVIDGADGTGKETQVKRLSTYPEIKNLVSFSFPNYGGFCGSLLRDVLCQKKGKIENVSTESFGLMFTLNRLSKRPELQWAKYRGSVVVLDRYYTANFGYQGWKVHEEELNGFLEYLERIEVDLLSVPAPDVVLYLDLPPLHALEAMKKDHTRYELDANETASIETKEKIRGVFGKCCKMFDDWHLINCKSENGDRASVDHVHNEIVSVLSETLAKVNSADPPVSSKPCSWTPCPDVVRCVTS